MTVRAGKPVIAAAGARPGGATRRPPSPSSRPSANVRGQLARKPKVRQREPRFPDRGVGGTKIRDHTLTRDKLVGALWTLETADAQVLASNTTTETTIADFVQRANSTPDGAIMRFRASGNYDIQAAANTITFRLKVGSTTIRAVVLTGDGTAQTGQPWQVEAWFTVRSIGSGGTLVGQASLVAAIAGAFAVRNMSMASTTTALDTTADNTFALTMQWNAANAANICRAEYATLTWEA